MSAPAEDSIGVVIIKVINKLYLKFMPPMEKRFTSLMTEVLTSHLLSYIELHNNGRNQVQSTQEDECNHPIPISCGI